MTISAQDYEKHNAMMKSQKEIGAFAKAFIDNKKANPLAPNGVILDSLTTVGDFGSPIVAMPSDIAYILDSFQGKVNKQLADDVIQEETLNLKQAILDGLQIGFAKYNEAQGGDIPHDAVVASAVLETANMLDSLDLSSMSHTHIAKVPNLVLVTIASRIANALPLVAMLPNPIGSNDVPLVNVRYIAKNARGHYTNGDYIDGDKSTLQFMDSAFEFEAETADRTTFTLTPKTSYKKGTIKANDAPEAKVLPFVSGGVSVFVNGVLVADDSRNANKQGTNAIVALNGLDFSVKDGSGSPVKVEIAQGSANLSTHEISITFKTALPDTAQVTIGIYADYERTDENNNPILVEPSLDVELEGRVLRGYANRASYSATYEALTQMQNELGVDPRSAFVAITTGKVMLEQNIRLLRKAKQRATGIGHVFIADMSRGAGGIAGITTYNNTRDIAVEILPTIDLAIMAINETTNHAPTGYDIYLSGRMAVLMNNLPDDARYVPTNNAVGALNQVIKIGTLRGSINVYCVPESKEYPIFAMGTTEDTITRQQVPFGELLVVARNTEAVKSVFVGFDVSPPMTKEDNTEKFKSGVTFASRQGRHVNPLGKYGSQVALIKVTNLPISLIGKV